MVYYPVSNGRSVDEFLRLHEALQTSDDHGIATPGNRRWGETVVVPPPQTAEKAKARQREGYECTDWHFCKNDLAA